MIHSSDRVFTMEREFTADCRLLSKSLPELIGLDGATTATANGILRRFLGMNDAILAKVEQFVQAGETPPPKLVNAANAGMRRLLDMAALNQKSAIEYLRALHRERALPGGASEDFLSDDDVAAIFSGGGSIFDLMHPRDRDQAGLAALPAPEEHALPPLAPTDSTTVVAELSTECWECGAVEWGAEFVEPPDSCSQPHEAIAPSWPI